MSVHPIQKLASVRWSTLWLTCAVLSGCELDRPNFHMNSNSPTPFFGIDLLPRRSTTSLVRPRLNNQVVPVPGGAPDVSPVDHTPGIGKFLKKSMKWDDQSERTIVLPLTKTDPEQPIDRGPVELLP